MKDDLRKRYRNYPDEKLESILNSGSTDYTPEAREVALELLKERGNAIAALPTSEELPPTLPANAQKLNYFPLILAIALLVFNFFAANAIYQYNITGNMEPEWLVRYLSQTGILHDILIRALVVVTILYYQSKRQGKYTLVWAIAGAIFGAWALLAAGIAELFASHSNEAETT